MDVSVNIYVDFFCCCHVATSLGESPAADFPGMPFYLPPDHERKCREKSMTGVRNPLTQSRRKNYRKSRRSIPRDPLPFRRTFYLLFYFRTDRGNEKFVLISVRNAMAMHPCEMVSHINHGVAPSPEKTIHIRPGKGTER
jgi:hypothetical protein